MRTVAQRRSFSREDTLGYLTAGALNPVLRHVPDEAGRQRILHEAASRVGALRRFDGSFGATFVRLELLVQRPR